MQVETIVNGGISLILSPETPLEEELIKGLMKQINDIQEFRTPQTILNKTFRNGIVIGKKSAMLPDKGPAADKKSETPDVTSDDTK
jgi:hypothetical protein